MKKVLAGLAMLTFVASIAIAQEAEQAPQAAPAAEEAIEYSYGTVVDVSAGQITVNEYDYDTGAETQVTYSIDTNAKFKNAASTSDIVPGDYVEIDYVIKNGTKVATVIYVEKQPAAAETPGAAIETPEEYEMMEEEPQVLPKQ